MNKLVTSVAALTLAAGAAQAGSIQRDTDRSQILFAKGKNFVEFSTVTVNPNISGEFAGVNSGDIANTYQSTSLSYKGEVNDKLTFAFIVNDPVGADIAYADDTGYIFAGSTAEVEAVAYTALLRYALNDNFSVYGGLRLQTLDGNVDLQAFGGLGGTFQLDVDNDLRLGYVLGVAYEKPEIGLRAALTYDSKIEHTFEDNLGDPFDVEIPQAVTLHLRSGVAANTLVFGSVRWQEWSEFEVAPNDFVTNPLNPLGLPIAFGADDYWTFEIGVGQRFNKNWSGAVTFGYENDSGELVGNLEGRDGFFSYGANVRYTNDAESYEITFGVKYFDLGSVNTTTINADFSGNDAIAAGVQVGFRF